MLTDIAECQLCLPGYYCDLTALEYPRGLCDAGFYCTEGSNSSNPSLTTATGGPCPVGTYCETGSSQPVNCVAGTYNNLEQQQSCLDCPVGYYCEEKAISTTECAPSHGVVTPKVCPAGFYCYNGTKTDREYPCPLGTYSNTTSLESLTECRDCPPGYYCEAENITEPTSKCFAGYYCVLASATPAPSLSSVGGPCPQGTYCPKGSSQTIPCPQGTYGDRPLLTALSECSVCPPGEYCAISGLSAPNGSCLAGYFCTNASEEANPVGKSYGDECPVGYYCPDHSYQPTACPAGTYQPFNRRVNDSDCIPCSPGKFCNITGAGQEAGDCNEGFYCIGRASAPSPYDGITGNICPSGSYCPVASPQHYYCPNGTYTNHSGAAVCYDCPDGHYCVNRDRADPCLPGMFDVILGEI
ncbi:hypothetical protein LOTGIDRAFT_111802 [Lottia gigantea]|uniref:Tyrosine-protein kinase ephrin type A/B receptor-like domain-containing protein n=1 Tax=Lottia gigantea TaxID=225164 RepID=V4B5F1_LOTGI|nr:hypothetical protein LOTGIDRAFT_111802 [Lottia gigantea]ESP01227.1 hypothetical protein LOTGIDRAFT_111802 [Lottia gigantea]